MKILSEKKKKKKKKKKTNVEIVVCLLFFFQAQVFTPPRNERVRESVVENVYEIFVINLM